MDSLLSPGLTTYDTIQGAEYRIAGVVRGSLTDADVQTALQALGLASLTYYGAGSTLPTDWPVESLPALGTNERYFRADGIWMQSSLMPTAYTATNGASIVFYQVWQHGATVQPITITSNNGVSIPGSPSVASNNWWIAGAVVSITVAGGLAYSAWKSGHHESHGGMKENPLYQENYLRHVNGRWALVSKTTGRPLAYYKGSGKPSQAWVSKQERRVHFFKYNKNPVQYHSSFKVHGVPVHVHLHDGKFCADYRAVDKYAPGKGGVVCGRTEAEAEDHARHAVAAALIQAKRMVGSAPKPKLYPSPWD